jgi:hypothetical protein
METKKTSYILFAAGIIGILILMSVAAIGQTTDSLQVQKDSITKAVRMMAPAQVVNQIVKMDSANNVQEQIIKDCSNEIKLYTDSLQTAKELSTKHDIETGILGELPAWKYLVGFFFSILGIIFMWLYLHKKLKKRLPDEKFFSADNLITRARTFALSVLTIFIVFRFTPQIANTEFSYFFALIVGLSIDYFTDLIANFKKVKSVETNN